MVEGFGKVGCDYGALGGVDGVGKGGVGGRVGLGHGFGLGALGWDGACG